MSSQSHNLITRWRSSANKCTNMTGIKHNDKSKILRDTVQQTIQKTISNRQLFSLTPMFKLIHQTVTGTDNLEIGIKFDMMEPYPGLVSKDKHYSDKQSHLYPPLLIRTRRSVG